METRKSGLDSNNNNNNNIKEVKKEKIMLFEEPPKGEGYLDQLPYEILEHVVQYLSPVKKMHLTKLGNKHLFFGGISHDEPAKTLIRTFLTHVVRGEKAKVEKMIKDDPCLLLEKMLVKDEAGRTIYGTAYQMALGAKDVSPFPQKFDEMVEMIEGCLKKLLPNGEKEMEKQYAEQFPPGFEEREAARQKRDTLALNKVFAAIKDAQTTEAVGKAIEEFHVYLKKQNEGIITTGYHFNEKVFEEANALYDSHYSQFGGYDSEKNNATAVGVIGGIQKYGFTGCLAQAACDGFGKLVVEQKPLSRNKLLNDKKTGFFDPNLGVSHLVYSHFAGVGVWAVRSGVVGGWDTAAYGAVFQKLCRAKTASWSRGKIPLLDENRRSHPA